MTAKMNSDEHERARKLIALASYTDPTSDRESDAWLRAHLGTCASCRTFAEIAAEAIRGLRGIPIAAERSLVSQTQLKVRQRALELQRGRERLWLVSVSCTAVTLSALLSAFALWHGFAWLGEKAHLASPVWEVSFLVFCLMPALVAAILLLVRDTHLADQTGSYQG